MLHTLLPKAHVKYLALPVLGSIVDGFDEWLIENGYTPGSREQAIRALINVDAEFQRRSVPDVSKLSRAVLYDSWRDLIKVFPNTAGTVRTLARYLNAAGVIATGVVAELPATSAAADTSDQYAAYLHKVRGFAASTISHHHFASRCFLEYLEKAKVSLGSIQPGNVENYITQAGQRMGRTSLQHEIAAIRGLLRFLASGDRIQVGLDRQIDTPRLYRLEQLPRALPWSTVTALLKTIDRKTAMGSRDYAMFLLIATYGLRTSEVVALSLDDIRWRHGHLRIHQRKTAVPLELPITAEVAAAIAKHLKKSPPVAPHRRVFLRVRAPIGALTPAAVTEAFQALVRKSGLDISFQGPHCLRHSLAVQLLKSGTPLKTIGDILGHRTVESTSMYLRLATGDLREVPLPVPGKQRGVKEVKA